MFELNYTKTRLLRAAAGVQRNPLIAFDPLRVPKKNRIFFKLKFLIFPISFLQRLGKNIKIYYLGFLKIITAGQYV